MKKIRIFNLLILFSIASIVSLFGQKEMRTIVDAYQLEAYHLTINKIERLKPKFKSTALIQCMLADSYIRIGKKEKGKALYREVANNFQIPHNFIGKYQNSIASSDSKKEMITKPLQQEIELPNRKSKVVELVNQKSDKNIVEIEELDQNKDKSKSTSVEIAEAIISVPDTPVFNSTVKKEKPTKTKDPEVDTIAEVVFVSETNSVISNKALPKIDVAETIDDEKVLPKVDGETETIAVEIKPLKKQERIEKTTPAKNPQKKSAATVASKKSISKSNNKVGPYRIRVGAFASFDGAAKDKIEQSGPVDIIKWGNKSIVFTGYFETAEKAKKHIKKHLINDYKYAVVVIKENGRYRSVN